MESNNISYGFLSEDKIYAMKLYSQEMMAFNGYVFMRLGRSRSEYYSIFYTKDNEIITTNSTKDGIDSVRVTNEFKNNKDKIDRLYLKEINNELRVFISIGMNIIPIDNEIISNVVNKFKGCKLIFS